MLQPHVFFEDHSNNRNSAKRGSIERAELANKQLGEARSIADKEYKEINIENAPNEISLCNNQTTKEVPMERCSYSTYVIVKGKEYSFEFKQDAVFAAQELGLKPAARKFKVSRNTLRAWSRRFDEKGKKGL